MKLTQKDASATDENKADNATTYSCPMHPDQKSGKPGKCSICGMDLIKSK